MSLLVILMQIENSYERGDKGVTKEIGNKYDICNSRPRGSLSISDRIVVMSNGEIVQIGKPEEIYYSPKNRYVAEFIGKINFFRNRK